MGDFRNALDRGINPGDLVGRQDAALLKTKAADFREVTGIVRGGDATVEFDQARDLIFGKTQARVYGAEAVNVAGDSHLGGFGCGLATAASPFGGRALLFCHALLSDG